MYKFSLLTVTYQSKYVTITVRSHIANPQQIRSCGFSHRFLNMDFNRETKICTKSANNSAPNPQLRICKCEHTLKRNVPLSVLVNTWIHLEKAGVSLLWTHHCAVPLLLPLEMEMNWQLAVTIPSVKECQYTLRHCSISADKWNGNAQLSHKFPGGTTEEQHNAKLWERRLQNC